VPSARLQVLSRLAQACRRASCVWLVNNPTTTGAAARCVARAASLPTASLARRARMLALATWRRELAARSVWCVGLVRSRTQREQRVSRAPCRSSRRWGCHVPSARLPALSRLAQACQRASCVWLVNSPTTTGAAARCATRAASLPTASLARRARMLVPLLCRHAAGQASVTAARLASRPTQRALRAASVASGSSAQREWSV
jgi:hypothetical protein